MNQFPSQWLDQNGFVASEFSTTISGNGILYTAVAFLLGFDVPNYEVNIAKCYYKTGCLMRNPQNTNGQEEWDDYLGLVAYCILVKNKTIPRQILWYGLKNLFVYDNVGQLAFKAWLGRFVYLWFLYWSAAFPWMKWLMFPFLWLTQLTFSTDLDEIGGDGYQLNWVYLTACKLLGFHFKKYDTLQAGLLQAFTEYYGANHPFVGVIK